jgi:hypothetical protein
MAENDNYMTLCPHCETYLPARTFRRHRDLFFNVNTNSWEKDPTLRDSSDDEILHMEIDKAVPYSPSHSHGSRNDLESSDDVLHQTLLDHEIWDDVLDHEVDEDTCENTNLPSVHVHTPQRPSHRTLLNCLVILLAFFGPIFLYRTMQWNFYCYHLNDFFKQLLFPTTYSERLHWLFPDRCIFFGKNLD